MRGTAVERGVVGASVGESVRARVSGRHFLMVGFILRNEEGAAVATAKRTCYLVVMQSGARGGGKWRDCGDEAGQLGVCKE